MTVNYTGWFYDVAQPQQKGLQFDTSAGRGTLDARGLVVAPGFIDLHQHGHTPGALRAKALDGVTAAFEMEMGVPDVDAWYREVEGRAPIHFGAAAGHMYHRVSVLTGALGLAKPEGTVLVMDEHVPDDFTGARTLTWSGECHFLIATVERRTSSVSRLVAPAPMSSSTTTTCAIRRGTRYGKQRR